MVEFEMLLKNLDWGIGKLVKKVVGWVEENGWLWLKGLLNGSDFVLVDDD